MPAETTHDRLAARRPGPGVLSSPRAERGTPHRSHALPFLGCSWGVSIALPSAAPGAARRVAALPRRARGGGAPFVRRLGSVGLADFIRRPSRLSFLPWGAGPVPRRTVIVLARLPIGAGLLVPIVAAHPVRSPTGVPLLVRPALPARLGSGPRLDLRFSPGLLRCFPAGLCFKARLSYN